MGTLLNLEFIRGGTTAHGYVGFINAAPRLPADSCELSYSEDGTANSAADFPGPIIAAFRTGASLSQVVSDCCDLCFCV